MKRFDQHWWYIERPFPWPLVVFYAVLFLTLAAGLCWVFSA